MTEARFSFTTKVNGDLFTVRGDNFVEFKTNLSDAVLGLDPILADIGILQAAGHAVPVVNVAAPVSNTWEPAAEQRPAPSWAPQPTTPPPAAQGFGGQGAAPRCLHGERTFRSGVSKATGKAWQAWFCPTPKDTPGQCEPDFLRS